MNIEERLDRQHFAETVEWLRGYAGLSQKELARRAGLPLSTIVRVEKGEEVPSDVTRGKLEKAIGCPLYYRPHEQVSIKFGDMEAEVDIGIAQLIRELWVAGIETTLSCQQNVRGLIWVQFLETRYCQNFLDIVARYKDGNDNLYWRIKAENTTPGPLPDWDYTLHVEDVALNDDTIDNCVEYSYDPPAEFFFTVSVRFPPQDLPIVLRRLKQHNRKVAGTGNPRRSR